MFNTIKKTIYRIVHLKLSRVLYITFNDNTLAKNILSFYSNQQAKKLLGKSDLQLVSLQTINKVNQGTHPDVLISTEVVPGEIIMTVSGYPFNIAKYENQYILRSKDGILFKNVFGKNAIATYEGNGLSHYSDGDMIEYDNKIYLYYRMCYNDCAEPHVTIYQRNTSDLHHWSEEIEIATGYSKDGVKYISPAIIKANELFYMYYVEMDKNNTYKFMMRKAASLDFKNYDEIQLKNNNEPEGMNIWHIDVVRNDNVFYGLFVYAEGYGGHRARLYEAISNDGMEWSIGEEIKLSIDYKHVNRIYRSTMIYRDGKWNLYISIRNDKLCWFIVLNAGYIFSFDNNKVR